MIRWLWKWLRRIVVTVLVLVVVLLSPIAYVETMCRGEALASDYAPILSEDYHRAEARTFLTYPEWHIVHAYDDYAEVIRDGDPHDYGYLQGITGFWSSLCALSEQSAAHGGFDWTTKQTIYTIGVSFTAELGLKAAYEETLGRLAVWARGPLHSPLDGVSARQAADYAAFLQQVPWYRWDFQRDVRQLAEASSESFRDNERRLALGIEYGVKSAYAGVIAAAVANVGHDALTLRMIVTGLDAAALEAMEGVTVIGRRDEGVEIETPRYRELTHLLVAMAGQGAEFVEIAGNDDIMFTAVSEEETAAGALFSFARQGYGDHRHLIAVKVGALAQRLRGMESGPLRLEHIHDY